MDVTTPPTAVDYEDAAVLRQALQRFVRATERVTRKHGLTTERYQLLLAIKSAEQRGGHITAGELAVALDLAPSTVTQLVRRAENLGLIRREHAEHDARVRYLRLTDEGAKRLAGALAELSEDRARLLDLLS